MEKCDEEIKEEELFNYIRNILKYQIAPMDYMKLRKLVKEAPGRLKLYPYIQSKYPAEEFLDFLKKYPQTFMINPDKTVQSYEASFCLGPSPAANKTDLICDEVDSFDKREYISDEELSDSVDAENHSDSDS